MLFTGIKAAAAPYMLAIKAAVVVVAFLVGVGTGCSWQADRDQKKVDKEIERTAEANGRATHNFLQGQALADQLTAISADTERQAEEARQRVKAASDAAALAEENARAARRAASAAQVALDKAKRDPDCKRLLETKSCAVIR